MTRRPSTNASQAAPAATAVRKPGASRAATGSRKATAQQRTGARPPRLSYGDWVDGALALLSSDGITAIKIPRVCSELGVTKGSFYWHFDDIDQLMTAMADRWSEVQSQAISALGEFESVPVEQRIENMAAVLVDPKNWVVEATVREWARSNATVAAAARALDQKIFHVVQNTLLDLGFDATQARLRAGAMVYLGIGFIHGRDSLPTPTVAETRLVIDLLTRS